MIDLLYALLATASSSLKPLRELVLENLVCLLRTTTASELTRAEIVGDQIDEMKRLAATTWWQDAPHTKNAV